MWDPATNSGIEDALNSAESLCELLDLMYASFDKMVDGNQTHKLLGLALNLSSDLSVWMKAEEQRRETKRN